MINPNALKAPTENTLEKWLNTPRPALCGNSFTPSEPNWTPEIPNEGVRWQNAITCVPESWQRWLQAALAYRMVECAQRTVSMTSNVLSRASQLELDPVNPNHIIDLRERFNRGEFANLCSFMSFWCQCESLEVRPTRELIDAFYAVPRKKKSKYDPILSMDPEEGPLTQAEQNALSQWLHDQFCNHNLPIEHYLYLRLTMIFGQRPIQYRMIIFDDFIKTKTGHKIRLFKGKIKGDVSWRNDKEYELFSISEDLFKLIENYKSIVLIKLNEEYPGRVNWEKAIKNVPLFRRKYLDKVKSGATPIMLDHKDQIFLENTAVNLFHIPKQTPARWLEKMSSNPSFPTSLRTHQRLKISNAHRFKHTLGTDLAAEGLDEWSISKALMHSNTHTVRKYIKISTEMIKKIDNRMSNKLALVVKAFTGTIVTDRTYAENGTLEQYQIEDLAICGADALCHLDMPFSCYACSKFQPLVNANHRKVLERLERRREQCVSIDKTTGIIWDRAILACRQVIQECADLKTSGIIHE